MKSVICLSHQKWHGFESRRRQFSLGTLLLTITNVQIGHGRAVLASNAHSAQIW